MVIVLVLALAVQVAGSQQLAEVDAVSADLLVGSWVLQITNSDRGLTYVAIHLGSKRLYIAEATVPAEYPPPADFQQSIYFIDENGIRVEYDLDYEGNKSLTRR